MPVNIVPMAEILYTYLILAPPEELSPAIFFETWSEALLSLICMDQIWLSSIMHETKQIM